MDHFTAGEIMLAIVLGLLSIAFGKWATRLDKVIESMDSIKKEVHDYILHMERRLTKTEERVRHHDIVLRNHTSYGSTEEDDE